MTLGVCVCVAIRVAGRSQSLLNLSLHKLWLAALLILMPTQRARSAIHTNSAMFALYLAAEALEGPDVPSLHLLRPVVHEASGVNKHELVLVLGQAVPPQPAGARDFRLPAAAALLPSPSHSRDGEMNQITAWTEFLVRMINSNSSVSKATR